MAPQFFQRIGQIGTALTVVFLGQTAFAEPQHGIAMYGEPALPKGFAHLPYVNPDAPKGGKIVIGNTGAFDSLNPYVLKGNVPWQMRFFTCDSLMGRNRDEPFALYGLIADSIETPEDRSWVEFTLHENAKFTDGTPITVDDVIWSYETLGTKGHPRYAGFYSKMDKIEQTGDRKVRMTFNTEDRELALLAGMRPILKKTQWEGKDFENPAIDDVPICSSAYAVSDYEPGRYVTLSRQDDYWARDLGFRKGTNNIDEIKIDFFGDYNVQFEAFKGGAITYNREFNANKWDTIYDFPAVQNGDIVKTEIHHKKPTGLTGFVFNTRREIFKDVRVRDALMHAFNFDYINETATGGKQPRITSYFSNSVLGMDAGPAEGRVKALLDPFAPDLPTEALSGYTLPAGDASERNRKDLRAATALLEQAGWTVDAADGKLKNAAGEPFEFSILVQTGGKYVQNAEGVVDQFIQALERLGITAKIEITDKAQFELKLKEYDYDMTEYRLSTSLSPGNEQYLNWGAKGVSELGTRNFAGVNSPAAEAMITAMLTATDQADFVAAAKALDRVIMSGRYVIPIWSFTVGRIAHDKSFKHPEKFPMYGEGYWSTPSTWWIEE